MITIPQLLDGPSRLYKVQKPNFVLEAWLPALPMPAPFVLRIKDAWEVLMGRAHALKEE